MKCLFFNEYPHLDDFAKKRNFKSVYLHIKGQLDFCLQIAVVDFEKAMDKFPQINILVLA